MERANLYENDTGIPGRVVVTSAYGTLKPRLRYIVDGAEMFVSIEDNPKLLVPKTMIVTIPTHFKGIADWIKINKANLLEFWLDPEMSTCRFIENLVTVNGEKISAFISVGSACLEKNTEIAMAVLDGLRLPYFC